ncbi:MAG: PaaI family thioesterase [Terriglobales bacterium]
MSEGTESGSANETLEPRPENPCFGCGGGNPRGLKLAFRLDRERRRVYGRFRLGAEYQGSQGILHGGIIALVLDEAMGKLTRLSGVRAVTAELRVEYLRPIAAEEEIVVEAEEELQEGRNLHFRAEIRNRAGAVLARGAGRFVIVSRREEQANQRTAGARQAASTAARRRGISASSSATETTPMESRNQPSPPRAPKAVKGTTAKPAARRR